MVDPVTTIVENFQSYRGKYNINSVVGGLLLYLSESGLGGSPTGSATELKQDQLITSLNNLLAENATDVAQEQIRLLLVNFLAENATGAKQDETIALLNKVSQQLEFLNGIGVVQPSQTAIVSSTVQEIYASSNIRKRVRITNHSPTDSILIELNGDASLVQGQIIGGGGTWESPGREEARSRITVISGTGNDVNISYQETIDFVLFFDIAEPTFANQNANLIDISYGITITDSLGYLSSLTIGLYEATTEQLISEQSFNSGLNNGATITANFLQVDAVEKTFYILIETN